MSRTLRALCAILLLAFVHSLQAAPRPQVPESRELDFLTANAAPRQVQLIARGDVQWFAFVAAAGETLSLDIAASEIADACGVDLEVVNAAGRRVARQACVAGTGPAATFTVPADGTYRLGLRARTAPGMLRLGLHSAARERIKPLACVTNALALDTVASGTWDGACASTSFSGHFAQYYTVTVPKGQVLSIIVSSNTNAYVVLHDGPDTNGVNIASDDNSGAGLDAEIVKSLAAGTYTIEATTSASATTGNFTVVARTNSAPCFAALKVNKSASGKWTTDCESEYLSDHYAKFYTLTVPADQVVTLTLSSNTNPYLVLRNGPTQLGAVIQIDDNSGPGTDAQIVRVLNAGTYTIEATTTSGSLLGDFTLVARTNAVPCFNKLSLNVEAAGSWSTACESVYFSDRYAQYYTLTVPSTQIVTIALDSVVNTYLVLHAGQDQLGPVLATDDNAGDGANARIIQTLPAGTYTIEATTASSTQLGDFTLAARTNTAPCFGTVTLNTAASDSWAAECTSVYFNDRYAKFYTLTLTGAPQLVTLTLDSLTNSYLVLRAGSSQLGAVVALDDNSGPGLDARISATLAAGTYTVEATTSSDGQLGDFSLVARSKTVPCNSTSTLDAVVSDSWVGDCASVSRADSYAKYYTFTVPSPQIVTTTLSSTTNAYLLLHAGSDQFGPIISQDNDSGASTDARLVSQLDAGTYTIEATTYSASQLGAFSLVSRTNSAPCFASIGLTAAVNGSWSTACTSTSFSDHYAKYYTLTVPSDRTMSILLTSTTTDAYLVLRGGPDAQLGPIVAQDNSSGGGTNAKISRTLTAGTYTIEATTNGLSLLGDFTLTTGN